MPKTEIYNTIIHIYPQKDRVLVKREAPNGIFEIKKYRTSKSRHSSAILQLKRYDDEPCDGIHLHLGSSKLGAAMMGRQVPDKYKRQAAKLQDVIDNATKPITVIIDREVRDKPTNVAIPTDKQISLAHD